MQWLKGRSVGAVARSKSCPHLLTLPRVLAALFPEPGVMGPKLSRCRKTKAFRAFSSAHYVTRWKVKSLCEAPFTVKYDFSNL
ncbi:hypothetical protein CEXT_767091 [Caerostris extrusa]|uniref:Secreted protein n=1 Tax=Caerostris extrusa TaxID=172846 RepID=A0AAV4YBM6_CAEEX|nr:hypothetical protein CEXT_767091 [Caerostris extrusa]